jgi:hypothetical protein
MVGYSYNSPGRRVYNPATRRITTSVHVKFQESVPGFATSHHVNSSIDVFFDADEALDAPSAPQPTNLSPDDEDLVEITLDIDLPIRVRGPLARFEDYVAHVSTVPRVCVTNACSPDLSDHVEDIVAIHDFSMMVTRPWHKSTEGPVVDVALVSASAYVEPASYREALGSMQSKVAKGHARGRLADI